MSDPIRIALRLAFLAAEVACWLALLMIGKDLFIEHWPAAISVILGCGVFLVVGLMIVRPLMDWRPVPGAILTVVIAGLPAAPFLIYGMTTLGWPVGLFGLAGIGNMFFSVTKEVI